MKILLPLFCLASFSLCAQKSTDFALASPPDVASILGEGFISTMLNERDFALSPDGKEIYYTISTPKSGFQTIVSCRKAADGKWSQPEVVSFAGEFSDLEPALSSDGKTLYFSSNRPLAGTEPKDFDIWKVARTGAGWGTPENLKDVSTPADEFYPSIAKNGNLYFTAAYPGGPGKEDIYVAVFDKNVYQKPVPLDTAVNSRLYEFNAFVSPDEQYILFTSYGRKDDAGSGDLYIALKGPDGKWKSAQNLAVLNSKQLDYCPYVSPDGKILFFTSERHALPSTFQNGKATYKTVSGITGGAQNGTGNIYWVNFQTLRAKLK